MARSRVQNANDFFLGGRKLGPWVAALSASASSSSAWTLLGVSGAAYNLGLAAVWLFPGCVGGFAVNWYLVAPRLRRLSHETGALTTTDLLAGPRDQPGARTLARVASVIILVSLLTYVASQFQGAGKTFVEVFGLSMSSAVLLGAGVIVVYTLLGGFWAVSITDSLQGLVMATSAVVLPAAVWFHVGGVAGIERGVAHVEGFWDLSRGASLPVSVGFVLGFLGIGLGYPGQPHVVNRFMALESEDAARKGRQIAMVWAVILYAGMLILGWSSRALLPVLPDQEVVFIAATRVVFPPVLAGVMIAAVLSAIMSTADSQLLVVASSVSHDLRGGSPSHHSLARSRWVVLALSCAAVAAALGGDPSIFDRVLFAWNAMGAAFGPLLLVTIWRGRPPWPWALAAMAAGFTLAVGIYWVPALSGGALERCVPFVVAFALAWWPLRGRSPRPALARRSVG